MSKADEQYTIFMVDDTAYETTLNKKFTNRKPWERPNPKLILSIIPGTILEIKVKEGDRVAAGSQLLTFEAMKMHTAVNAPFDGTIKSINVAQGDKVPKGVLMVEFE